jgi:hypothetical protein
MSWIRRARDTAHDMVPPPGPSAVASAVDAQDSPRSLGEAVDELDRFINRNAGRVPPAAVVNARGVTDTLRTIIGTSATHPLDVYAVISVRGIAQDYLPTTLKGYLAVAPELLDVPRASGDSPTRSLMKQLDALQSSASATLVAARDQDADALMTQGTFLRVKFSGSDLDL